MQKIKKYISLVIFVLLFWQCSEIRQVDPLSLGSQYFPLKVGDYRIYNVSGVRYINIQDSIEYAYQLKESVIDSFTNLESGISFTIQREKRNSELDTWAIDSIWTARKTERTAIMVENNMPIIKLSFPIGDSVSWDGNRLNDQPFDEYKMVNINTSFSNESTSYNNTLTVVQEDLSDPFVQNNLEREIYAENIGLIFKDITRILYAQNEYYGLQKINSGIKYYQSLTEYGKE